MKLWEKYHVPHTVADALAQLQQYDGAAQIVAGGTDLLIDLQQGNHPPVSALIDITKIDEMTQIVQENDSQNEYDKAFLIIGAGVTHNRIVKSAIANERATCLAESCGVVGGPQVRNVATIGGNVAHAMPAADGTLSLVALGAEAEIADSTGRTWIPIEKLFLAPGKSIINPSNQLLTKFRISLTGARAGSAFKRIMRPQGVALPILGCAVRVKLDEDLQTIHDVAICLGPITPTPSRATEVETWLKGRSSDVDTILSAAKVAQEALPTRGSKYRSTAEYRTEMIGVLLREALTIAIDRARTGNIILGGVEH